MAAHTLTVEAVYEDGVLRPVPPLPLAPRQRVTVTVEVPPDAAAWPELVPEERLVEEVVCGPVPDGWPLSER
ncbi:MAG TPA: antitoxin family protein [Gemmataceae bacterium]|nr:antitoxin family protein [Gemmataceae bacterium]